MLTNFKKDRVLIRTKTLTQGAMGQTETFTPAGYKYALVKPVSAVTQAAYQQLGSVVTHEITFSGEVSIAIDTNDILWGSKTLTLTSPPKVVNGNTIIGAQE
jgi:hypothetical protein